MQHHRTVLPDASFMGSLDHTFFDAHTPVRYHEQWGTWLLFSYAHVLRVLMNSHGEFSFDFAEQRGIHPTYAGLWAADNPRHADLLRIGHVPLQRRFGMLEQQGADVCRAHAFRLAHDGSLELMGDFVAPCIWRILDLLLDFDIEQEAPGVEQWLRQESAAWGADQVSEQPDLVAFFTSYLEQRRAHPRAGFIDDLLAAQQEGARVEGQPMRDWDVIGYIWMLISATSTTATAIGNAVLVLVNTGLWSEVRKQPALLPLAIEESLRLYPPFLAVPAWTRREVAIGGKLLGAGEMVMAWITSANRDPEKFPEPDRFLLSRTPVRLPHLSFGLGLHRCLGAHLARVLVRQALLALLEQPWSALRVEEHAYRFGVVNVLDRARLQVVPRGGAAA